MSPVPNVPQNLLLIRLKSIGDVVFTLPALHAVRENFPAARLHFLVSQEHAPLVAAFSAVDAVLPLNRKLFRSGKIAAAGGGVVRLLRALRTPRFSHAIDLQGYGETEWLAWWTGAAEKWGTWNSSGRGWLYTRQVTADLQMHPVARHLDLLAKCGLKIGRVRNEFTLPPEALAAARAVFTTHQLRADRPTLFIQPLTSAAYKNWPLGNYLAVARDWRAQGLQVIFGGGPADLAALRPVSAAGFPVVAGTPLLVSAGLMRLSSLSVGGDTGMLHLAVAMGCRVVMLMGCKHPGCPHPFQHEDWAVTPAPGNQMADLKIDRVTDAITQALAEAPAWWS